MLRNTPNVKSFLQRVVLSCLSLMYALFLILKQEEQECLWDRFLMFCSLDARQGGSNFTSFVLF